MLGTFENISKNFKIKPQAYFIDNWGFRMHYRVTTLIFFVATVLVTSQQYIGEHIKCIGGKDDDKGFLPNKVLNTYCFFSATYTVIKYYNDTLLEKGEIPHPGVGSYGLNSDEPIVKHAYYQWVPFVLFAQAIMFHLTHLLWKKFEGGRIRLLIDGLKFGAFALLDKEVTVKDNKIPSKEAKAEFMEQVKKVFIDRIYFNKSWSRGLIFCEVLNILNVVLQVFITDQFLGGKFLTLGVKVMNQGLEEPVTVLDEVFPKVTKCNFHKYGPSGGIQLHDAMCVMALNIVNEKIYLFLWFWFIVLFFASCLSLLWRLTCFFLHCRSSSFNRLIFSGFLPGKMNPWDVMTVTQKCDFTGWLFLKYLAKNLDALVFRELFLGLAEDLDNKNERDSMGEDSKSLIDLNSDGEGGSLEKLRKFD